jgi:hypothetical protein
MTALALSLFAHMKTAGGMSVPTGGLEEDRRALGNPICPES